MESFNFDYYFFSYFLVKIKRLSNKKKGKRKRINRKYGKPIEIAI
jgi:hypothetical protein